MRETCCVRENSDKPPGHIRHYTITRLKAVCQVYTTAIGRQSFMALEGPLGVQYGSVLLDASQMSELSGTLSFRPRVTTHSGRRETQTHSPLSVCSAIVVKVLSARSGHPRPGTHTAHTQWRVCLCVCLWTRAGSGPPRRPNPQTAVDN